MRRESASEEAPQGVPLPHGRVAVTTAHLWLQYVITTSAGLTLPPNSGSMITTEYARVEVE